MIADPIQDGLKSGWSVFGPGHRPAPAVIDVDVVIVGTGAGAGVTAELLSRAGLTLALVEEGPLRSSSDFHQRESDAYPALYQESAARKTADKAVTILQGRCVGGSTTVNWTSSFRTPSDTLGVWRKSFGLDEYTDDALSPWFAQAEQRLGIAPWLTPPNENNELLRRGAMAMGIAAAAIQRNVKGCWNLGSCGMGCPTNAKQSMLVTTLPVALDRGAILLVQSRAQRILHDGARATGVECVPVQINGDPADGGATTVRARHVVVGAGAINGPGLMMRSRLPDPHGTLGARTFLHPVVISAAVFDHVVAGWEGAPQTIYSDHYLEVDPIDGPIGYKLEAPPIHPVIFTSTLPGLGKEQASLLADFPRTHALLALLRDGFHPKSPGGYVRLRGDGSAELDYPFDEFIWDGARRAFQTMAEIQFAAGARQVLPVHEDARPYTSLAQARAAIAQLPMQILRTRVVSAHVMGGCAMAADARRGVVRPDGTHWQIDNLSVHDGSIFPTSIGANPQLSIYGIVNMLATRLARRLTGKSVSLV